MDQRNHSEKSIAQNEVTLAALRAPALELIQQGIESSYTSQATKTEKGLQVRTVDDKTHVPSLMLVDGKADAVHRTVDWSGIHFDVALHGDFSIKHQKGKQQWNEKATFDLVGSDWDNLWNRSDKFNTTIKRMDEKGRLIQAYAPAISEEQTALDPNGQAIRLAKPAGTSANCGIENIYNRNDKRMLCEYIVDGKVSYNESREQFPAIWSHRSVVRDMKGTVLGIVHQDYRLDDKGDITSVSTSARKPMKLRQGN